MRDPRAGMARLRTGLLVAMALVVAAAIVGLGWKVAGPLASAAGSRSSDAASVAFPAFNLDEWKTFPVQEGGRIKPFQTFAIETVRTLTGRAEFRGLDPVAVALMWILRDGADPATDWIDWEEEPFLLCDHRGLRRAIFGDSEGAQAIRPEEELGKFVSPSVLRQSAGFQELLRQAQAIRAADREKAQQYLSPEQAKAEEVARRLALFESLGRNRPARSPVPAGTDPLRVVALDRVRGSGWFSVGQLRSFEADAGAWSSELESRAQEVPQDYLSREAREALEVFQSRLLAGETEESVEELEATARGRAEEVARRYIEMRSRGDEAGIRALLAGDVIASPAEEREFLGRVGRDGSPESVAAAIRAMVMEKSSLDDLKQRIRSAAEAGYRPDDPQFRMLHRDYLEARFRGRDEALHTPQPYPSGVARRLLASFDAVRGAFVTDDPASFEEASAKFFQAAEEARRGNDAELDSARIALEVRFNEVHPFRWAWVLMLTSAALLAVSLAVRSRVPHVVGLVLYTGSLAFQAFGFYARVSISGRAPVSNMYESIIFVGAMAGVFALLLEAIERRRVVALAGALVSTLSLVLADQLPMVFDPKISPLVPVLRSNYWLVVHVLTIVSSYAAGAVAWALGNLTMGLVVFGRPGRETIRLLSRLTYRAIQLAVLLLAAGTFLGGWWAAESWGRFWGWDPKEVWALIALVAYVIPLHARYLGWVKDFGLAVSSVVCFAAIVMSWYGVNYVLGAGLHSYGFGGGGPWWVLLGGLINLEYVLIAGLRYRPDRGVGEASLAGSEGAQRGPHLVLGRGRMAANGQAPS